MIKIVVLSYGVWVSLALDSMADCERRAERIFQINPTAQVWCCDQVGCMEQQGRAQ